MPPVINKDACTVCGICVKICPMDVFFGSKKKKFPRTDEMLGGF